MLLLLPRPVLLLSQNLGAVPSPCGQRLPWGRPARDSSPSTPRILPQQVGTGLSDRRAQELENPAVFPKHKPWMARSRMHAVTQASQLGQAGTTVHTPATVRVRGLCLQPRDSVQVSRHK